MNNKKKWGKIKRILSFVVSVVIIYYGLGFLDGSIYTGSYTKQFDDTVVTSVHDINFNSHENYMGRVVKLKGAILGELDENKDFYVLQTSKNASEDTLAVIKNNTELSMERGDTVEVSGFYAGRKKVSLENGVNTSAVVIDTLIADEIDADELIYRPAKERETFRTNLNIKSDRDENTGVIANISDINKYKNNNVINFGISRPGRETYMIKSLKVEKYVGNKLLEIENIKLLNHQMTEENYGYVNISSRCDFEVTKVKIILEYTGLDGETVRTSTVEVEFPKEVIR
ncbi:MAG: hypothetical protein ACRCWG_10945 [Sarcina sp.]